MQKPHRKIGQFMENLTLGATIGMLIAIPILEIIHRKINCEHSLDKSTIVHKIKLKSKYKDIIYAIDIRKCNKCKKHFIDEGYEYRDKTMHEWKKKTKDEAYEEKPPNTS